MTVGIIISNYNRWDLVQKCVDQILQTCGSEVDKILIVDDCSPIKNPNVYPEPVQVIRNEYNLGYVKTINVGLRTLQTDLVLIFDSDAYPLSNIIPKVKLHFTHDPSLGMLGFRTVNDRNEEIGAYEPEPTILNLILGQKMMLFYDHHFRKDEGRICIFSCAVAIRKTCLDKLGIYDEEFQHLDADTDFCLRLYENNWKVLLDKGITVYHKGGSSVTRNAKRVLMVYKSRWKLLQKHGMIRFQRLSKYLIVTRLFLEYLFLAIFGKLLYPSEEIYKDKRDGRWQIFKYCFQNY